MSYLPSAESTPTSSGLIGTFGGFNATPAPSEAEFAGMRNLSSRAFPAVAPREKRRLLRALTKPNGLFAHDNLAWVDGTTFYYDGTAYGAVADSRKRFVGMGAYILIWPDKLRFHTVNHTLSSLENHFVAGAAAEISFGMCRANGTLYTDYTQSATAPASPSEGSLWLDTGASPNQLKSYSATSAAWVAVATTYIRIGATGLGAGFATGDGVRVTGCTNAGLNRAYVLQDVGADYITVIGVLGTAFTQTGALHIERTVPDMDYVCENDNRIWGCSSADHRVYACKLGDPTNWECYAGLSTDSYYATVGSKGSFTGIASHMGYVLFFKEEEILKLMGYKPSNYELSSVVARGVESGSADSLLVMNEVLYYKSAGGICVYSGTRPEAISEALGARRYHDAVAGALGERYYVGLTDADGGKHLFVYDSRLQLWHREDEAAPIAFASCGNVLYFIEANGRLWAIGGSAGDAENDFDWVAETGDIGAGTMERKRLIRLLLRMEVEAGARIRVAVQYDRSGVWVELNRVNMMKKNVVSLPILPRRCDTLRLRLSGRGEMRWFGVYKLFEEGSER